MSEERNETQQDAYDGLSQSALEKLMEGKRGREVIQEFIDGGLDEATAKRIVTSMMHVRNSMNEVKSEAAAERREGMKPIWLGAIVLLLGLGLTGFSYYEAVSRGGGEYLIYPKLILVGAVMMVYGGIQYWLNR